MPKLHKVVVHLSDEDMAKVEREAQTAGWTDAMWIEWLVHDYAAPDEADPDE